MINSKRVLGGSFLYLKYNTPKSIRIAFAVVPYYKQNIIYRMPPNPSLMIKAPTLDPV